MLLCDCCCIYDLFDFFHIGIVYNIRYWYHWLSRAGPGFHIKVVTSDGGRDRLVGGLKRSRLQDDDKEPQIKECLEKQKIHRYNLGVDRDAGS